MSEYGYLPLGQGVPQEGGQRRFLVRHTPPRRPGSQSLDPGGVGVNPGGSDSRHWRSRVLTQGDRRGLSLLSSRLGPSPVLGAPRLVSVSSGRPSRQGRRLGTRCTIVVNDVKAGFMRTKGIIRCKVEVLFVTILRRESKCVYINEDHGHFP